MCTVPKEKRGTETVPRNFLKEYSLYGKPYTNESRNLRQARPNKVGAVDLPRKNTLATPSMGFFNNNDYTIPFCLCQAFFEDFTYAL